LYPQVAHGRSEWIVQSVGVVIRSRPGRKL
jgi:hypothetical protein